MKFLWVVVLWLGLGIAGLDAQTRSADAPDPKIGTWKLRAQSPAAGAREYEDRGCGIVVSTRQGIDGSGRSYFSQYAAKYDGKEYPRAVKGATTANTISFTTVDAYSVDFTLREDGKVVSRGTTTVSRDGKVLTVTTRREGFQGPGSVEVYDRQPAP
jgi:hypothetical protein